MPKEMRYVQRDEAGNVVGHFANPQHHRDGTPYAVEEVPEDHPDILDWEAHRKARQRQEQDRFSIRKLEARISELEAEVRKLKGQ